MVVFLQFQEDYTVYSPLQYTRFFTIELQFYCSSRLSPWHFQQFSVFCVVFKGNPRNLRSFQGKRRRGIPGSLSVYYISRISILSGKEALGGPSHTPPASRNSILVASSPRTAPTVFPTEFPLHLSLGSESHRILRKVNSTFSPRLLKHS